MIVAGPLENPDSFRMVIDSVSYVCDSILETVCLTFEALAGQGFAMPKVVQQPWVCLEKAFFRRSDTGFTVNIGTNQAFGRLQKQLGFAIE